MKLGSAPTKSSDAEAPAAAVAAVAVISAVPYLEPAGCLAGAVEGKLAHDHTPNAVPVEVEKEAAAAAAHGQMS